MKSYLVKLHLATGENVQHVVSAYNIEQAQAIAQAVEIESHLVYAIEL